MNSKETWSFTSSFDDNIVCGIIALLQILLYTIVSSVFRTECNYDA